MSSPDNEACKPVEPSTAPTTPVRGSSKPMPVFYTNDERVGRCRSYVTTCGRAERRSKKRGKR
jgi:hypothetical protein